MKGGSAFKLFMMNTPSSNIAGYEYNVMPLLIFSVII